MRNAGNRLANISIQFRVAVTPDERAHTDWKSFCINDELFKFSTWAKHIQFKLKWTLILLLLFLIGIRTTTTSNYASHSVKNVETCATHRDCFSHLMKRSRSRTLTRFTWFVHTRRLTILLASLQLKRKRNSKLILVSNYVKFSIFQIGKQCKRLNNNSRSELRNGNCFIRFTFRRKEIAINEWFLCFCFRIFFFWKL